MATLDKSDALLFAKFCGFAWMIGGVTALVLDENHEVFEKNGINFSSLTHLDNLGLITFNNLTGFVRRGFGKYAHLFYYGKPVIIEFPQDANEFQLGKVLFTRAGQELATVCGSRPFNDYFEFVLEKWMNSGYLLSSPVKSKEDSV